MPDLQSTQFGTIYAEVAAVVADRDATIATLTSNDAALNQQLLDKQAEYDTLAGQVSSLNDQIQNLNSYTAQVNSERDAAVAERNTVIDGLNTQLAQLQSDFDAYRAAHP
jgi:outer membrane murein-binding lipoprotein Lpp